VTPATPATRPAGTPSRRRVLWAGRAGPLLVAANVVQQIALGVVHPEYAVYEASQ